MTTPRARPPLIADETTSLRSWLAFHRDTFRTKTGGLTTAQLHTSHPPTSLTLGGLVQHLAYVEDNWLGVVLLGREHVEPWASADWDADHDWEFTTAPDHSSQDLTARWEAAVGSSERILDDVLAAGEGLGTLSKRSVHGQGPCDLRWILVHLIEEYARHNGHADLIREAVDGSVGV